MRTLPRISGRECVKALSKIGFVLRRQHGSHMILRRINPFAQLVVPDHKELTVAPSEQSFTRQLLQSMSLQLYCKELPATTPHRRKNGQSY